MLDLRLRAMAVLGGLLALGGCQVSATALRAVGLQVGLAEIGSEPARAPGAGSPGPAGTGAVIDSPAPSGLQGSPQPPIAGNGGPQIISDAGAALVGTVTRPDGALISNNSANLTDVGGGEFYRLGFRVLGVSQTPVAQALVSLVDDQGQAVSAASVLTDSQGRFRFATLPQASDSYFVQAAFTVDGQAFRFRNLVHPPESAAAATADIDAATTLVSEKLGVLARRRELQLRQVAAASLRNLLDRVRAELTRERVPFMAVTSQDIASTFDQLSLDVPGIKEAAAALNARLAAPTQTWRVEKVFDSDDLIRLGVHGASNREFSRAGTFEVDPDGNFYFPAFVATGSPTPIYKVTPDGAKSVFAMLPPGTTNPIAITFGADGTFYATAMEISSRRLRVLSRAPSGDVKVWPFFTSPPVPAGAEAQPINGRVAVDDEGTLYQALPFAHFVASVIMPGATADAAPLAGAPGQAGFADGPGTRARFTVPRSLVRGPDGAIFVADEGNGSIRRISQDRVVSTVAGRPGQAGYVNGRGVAARFGRPTSLVFDAKGNLFITDAADRRIRRLSRDGSVFLVGGSGAPGIVDGDGPAAEFFAPSMLAIDRAGNLYVLDTLPPGPASGGPKQFIRKISLK